MTKLPSVRQIKPAGLAEIDIDGMIADTAICAILLFAGDGLLQLLAVVTTQYIESPFTGVKV